MNASVVWDIAFATQDLQAADFRVLGRCARRQPADKAKKPERLSAM